MKLLFWLCTLTIIHVYALYPMLLLVVGTVRRARQSHALEHLPTVTIIVSAFNEAAVIREKLENALTLDYPPDLLDIIVVSDCSDDGTDEIVTSMAAPRVELLRMSERSGKSVGLNAAVARARGEVLVFTDANAMFDAQALRHLTSPFADSSVGVVTGEQRYVSSDSASGDEEGTYWRYELLIKRWESRCGSLVGGDGAIMAMRRSLFVPLEASDLSDFLLPLRVVAAGYRNQYQPLARCYEHGSGDPAREFNRKVRIVNRAWRATMKMKELLNPLRHGWFAFQLLSHKVLRWLAGLFMAGALISNAALATSSALYSATFAGQCAFYVLAAIGWSSAQSRTRRWFAIPYYFCLVNFASLKGIFENYRGETYTTWATARHGSGSR